MRARAGLSSRWTLRGPAPRRRATVAALLAFIAFSGLQCVQDLITPPPDVTYVFDVTPTGNDSALVNVGDTIQPITGTLTADGRPAGFTLGCTVTSGAGVVQVDTVAGCRLIVTGRGVAQLTVRPRSVSLPVDTIQRTVKVVALVPRIALAATPAEDTLYSLLETKTLQATAQTRGHVAIAGVPITWRLVSGANFVTLVDASTGTVRADSNGFAVLEATVDTAHAQRTVRVRQRATAIVLGAPQVRLRAVGQTWSVGATLRDARTNSVYDRSVTWTSRNTNVVRVTAGQLTAVAEGATYVVASFSDPTVGGPALADSTAVIVQLARLQVTSGTPQTDTVGAPVGVPLAVRLVDGSGTAITDVGVPVVFKALTGGGKFGTADSVVVSTVAAGVASATPTLGSTAGMATFTAYVPGALGAAVTFTLTGVPDAPSAIVVDSGAAQTDTVLKALSKALVVQVRDRFGNAVPGATVRFVVTAGGGKVATNQDSVILTTDAAGRARTTHTLGSTSGAHTVTARAAFGTPVTFTATAAPARAKRLRFTQQPANLVAGGSFSTAPVVQVQDSLGNVVPSAVPSVALALATNSAGATLGGTATVTAAAGVGTFSALTIGKTGTALRIVATSTGLAPDTSAAFNVTSGTRAPSTSRRDS